MKRNNDFNSIGALYGDMLNDVRKELIKEGKKQPPNAFNSKLPVEKSKPIDGYNQPLNDERECPDEDNEETPYKKPSKLAKTLGRMDKSAKNPKLSDKQRNKIKSERERMAQFRMEEDNEDKKSEKNYTESINRIMKQSAFDKLVKKVLKENFGQEDTGELDALGLDDSTPDSDLDDEFGGEDEFGDEGEGDGESVTFTLDRATAQTLIDVLQGALGGDVEDDLGGEDDLDLDDEFGGEGDDEFGGEEDGLDFDEDEEEGTKPAPDKKGAFQTKNNKVGGKANPKGAGKAKTDVTDETGTKDGAPSFTALQGKSNKVPGQVSVGDFFK